MRAPALLVCCLLGACVRDSVPSTDPDFMDAAVDAMPDQAAPDAMSAPDAMPEPPDAMPEAMPEPEPPPEPDPMPDPEEDLAEACAAACDRIVGCFEAECSPVAAETATECMDACLADPDLIERSLGACPAIVSAFSGTHPAWAAGCEAPRCEPVGPRTPELGTAGNLDRIAAAVEAALPALRAAVEVALDAVAPNERPALADAVRPVLAIDRVCVTTCTAAELDAALSAFEAAWRALSAVDAPTTRCLVHLAQGLVDAHAILTEATCGPLHGSTRLLTDLARTTDVAAMVCGTRNAHDVCQVPYANATPLGAPGRCGTCEVSFGMTRCAIPIDDACTAVGECLCEAAGADAEACEFLAFGARGAITWAESCGGSSDIASALLAPFDGRGLVNASSESCLWTPAVLEARQCDTGLDGCWQCQGLTMVPSQTCEVGHEGCSVRIHCGQRYVGVTGLCLEERGPLCPAGWSMVEVCDDARPCEIGGAACGVRVMCQPDG